MINISQYAGIYHVAYFLFCFGFVIITNMKEINFRTRGICAVLINVQVDDEDRIADVSFLGGCDGNHKGLVALCKGMKRTEVIERLKGITCGMKSSSCPDQLARALEEIK